MATVRTPRQKVILCGDYGVGKSSLFRRFANNSFVTETDRKSTLGLDHIDREYNVGEKQLKVRVFCIALEKYSLNNCLLNSYNCGTLGAWSVWRL